MNIASIDPNLLIALQALLEEESVPAELGRSIDSAVACVPDAFRGFYRQRLLPTATYAYFETGTRKLLDSGMKTPSSKLVMLRLRCAILPMTLPIRG
jgi:hypothetical protein